MPAKVKKEMDMINGPLLKKLIVFSVPVILSGILQLLFNAADVVVVGQFAGTESLAAVGSNGSLITLITNLFIGLSVGANVVMARAIGANDPDKASRTAHTSVLTAVVSGAVVTVFGFFMARTMLTWMNTDPEVLDKATLYLEIYFLGSVFTLVYNFGAALLRAKGDTQRPLYFLVIAGVVNVALNLLFVIVCKMDVAGVALATVISQAVSAVLVVIWLIRDKIYANLKLRKLRFYGRELKEIFIIGLPSGIYSTFFSISNVIIQTAVNGFGKTVMAGNTTAANIEGFVYIAMNSVQQAAVTFTGQNYGAKKYERIKTIMLETIAIATVIGVVLGGIVLLLRRQLCAIYSPDPEVIEYAMERMKVILLTYWLCGIMDNMVGVLRGMGYSLQPMFVSFLSSCILRIVWVYTVFAAMPSLTTLFISYPVSWVISIIALTGIFIFGYKRMLKRAAAEKAASGLTEQALELPSEQAAQLTEQETSELVFAEVEATPTDEAPEATEEVAATADETENR